ncbi:MAG: phosphatidate cytidylyltransferase [Prevotella bivia]|uniref:phosphatidate cytidylyltransferase n=1 Tax=Prevotella bivia TaxID=28125 RepID=UPI00050E16C0|nr:phosphatidate cytidylyltransferase [Prevotella bivia]KGF23466.1 phosphatidate cytidylyltransferase [Prevotella bivia DNF00188]MDU2113030.1 phosphatidate cytidylyltransferase [Prevotella bivia]WIL18248.1 phosphatidate cytidylyltransferase [Prevotella bivia]
MTEKQSNFITRAIFGILFVVVMVGSFTRPDFMVGLFAIITGLTIWEYTGLVNSIKGVSVNRLISTIAGIYFFLAVAGIELGMVRGFVIFVPYILCVVYLLVAELYLKNENPIHSWAYTMLGQMYITLPLSLINILAFGSGDSEAMAEPNMLLPLSIFILLWTNDTGAYCTGSLFGKHKLFPRISPGKSWEGSIGGGVLSLIVAGLIGYWANSNGEVQSLNIPVWIGLGLVVVVFGTWGDLVESLFKRTIGVKDSGKILPGHGGMLDRFDSSLLAIPAAVVYIYTLSQF